VFLVAGEPSGDNLGARLMAGLKRQTGGAVRFSGIGGGAMVAEGLDSLFPIRELSLMGFAEILPHLPRLIRRLNETAETVRRTRPDAVVTIDSPGFTFRLAKRLRGTDIPIVHYVAPQVWAWKPERAAELKGLVDHLMTLLPFEPPYFEEHGIPCTFVGHPVLESGAGQGDGAAFRARHGLMPDSPLVCVLPGSRTSEVGRLLPVFGQALDRLGGRYPGLNVVVPVAETVAALVSDESAGWTVPTIPVTDAQEKFDAFAASSVALTKSGTSTLELALAGVPMVVSYRMNPVTGYLAKRALQIPHVALINLLAEHELVPELLQGDCEPGKLADALATLLENEPMRDRQRTGFRQALGKLGGLSPTPSDRAAKVVLDVIAQRRGLQKTA
jgi:lipid-A-disaccharide synthase